MSPLNIKNSTCIAIEKHKSIELLFYECKLHTYLHSQRDKKTKMYVGNHFCRLFVCIHYFQQFLWHECRHEYGSPLLPLFIRVDLHTGRLQSLSKHKPYFNKLMTIKIAAPQNRIDFSLRRNEISQLHWMINIIICVHMPERLSRYLYR